MYILLALIILVLLIIFLLLVVPVKVKFDFVSYPIFNFKILSSWLNPFIKVEIINKDTNFFLYIYLFNKIISKKKLKIRKTHSNNLSILKELKPKYVDIKTHYGFYDPSFTGIMYAMINLLSNYIPLDNLSNNPDFSCEDTYIDIEMFLEFSFFSLLKLYRRNSKNNLEMQPSR